MCGHKGRLLAQAVKTAGDVPANRPTEPTAAVLSEESVRVGYSCADCGKPLSELDAAFVCCDECWDKYYKQASPFERQQARERR